MPAEPSSSLNTTVDRTERRSMAVSLSYVLVVVLVIVATTLLAIRHDIPSDAVVGLLGAALGASGHAALQSPPQIFTHNLTPPIREPERVGE